MNIRQVVVAYCCVALVCGNSTLADAWVERMLTEKQYDFGIVSVAADAVHRLPVKNIYKHDIELVSVRSSCGCTSVSLETTLLKPNEIGHIDMTLNTRAFTGQRDATITLEAVWVDNGIRRTGEAAIRIHGVIEGDLAIEPDAVVFNNVELGTHHEQKVRISTSGKKEWRIKEVVCNCSYLETELSEPNRFADRIVYEMLVRLTGCTPPGHLQEKLYLITDDETKPQIPLYVSGRVVEELFVAPELLFFGKVALGQQTSKKIIVRGARPFRILKVGSESGDFRFTFTHEILRRHIVKIAYRPEMETVEQKRTIEILTDAIGNEQLKLVAYTMGTNASE